MVVLANLVSFSLALLLLCMCHYDESWYSGRHGYGAKLTNIFSTEFTVEIFDRASGNKFRQVYHDNMSRRSVPEIVPHNDSASWTKITFTPGACACFCGCCVDQQ